MYKTIISSIGIYYIYYYYEYYYYYYYHYMYIHTKEPKTTLNRVNRAISGPQSRSPEPASPRVYTAAVPDSKASDTPRGNRGALTPTVIIPKP